MDTCPYRDRLSAYHDGETVPVESAVIELHLSGCPDCTAELSQLRRLSDWLADQPEVDMPAGLSRRLHRALDRAGRRGILRFAETLAAIAASILLACVLRLVFASAPSGGVPPDAWEGDALNAQVSESADATDDSLASWIAQDMSEDSE